MIAKVLGYSARFCNRVCMSSFKCDRESGLNYGLHTLNGVTCMHREEWSLASRCCAYCGDGVDDKQPIPKSLVKKFKIPMESPTLKELIEDFRDAYHAGEADDEGALNCMVEIDGRELLVLANKTQIGFKITIGVPDDESEHDQRAEDEAHYQREIGRQLGR